jgi:EAL domain-containing protein (putative c-di-GMP-specific phosphodiesterase class I)
MQFGSGVGHQSYDAVFNIVQGIAQVLSAQLTVTRVETSDMRKALLGGNVDFLQGICCGEARGVRGGGGMAAHA